MDFSQRRRTLYGSIAINDEQENLIIDESSNVENIIEVHTINFQSFSENELLNCSNLKFVNCPSVQEVLNLLPRVTRSFFQQFCQAISVHFLIHNEIEDLNEVQLLELAISLKETEKSCMISFESSVSRKLFLYWRINGAKNIFSIALSGDTLNVANFVQKFMSDSLRNNHNVIHPSINFPRGCLRIIVTLNMLADHRGYDLLFLAVEEGRLDLVSHLLDHCDVKYSIMGRCAADVAYEKKYYNILFCLLLANSRFPNNFQLSSEDTSLPNALRRFILTSKNMHDAINSKNIQEVRQIIIENPGLKFVFNTRNVSALAAAMCVDDLEIYKLLIEKNLSLGHHEILGDILESLSSDKRKLLGQINEENFQNISEKHIFILMSNTNVGPDDNERQTRLACVCQAFLRLNSIPRVKILLEIVAASRNVQINFDFKRDHIQFIDPRAEPYVNGLFRFQGKIYIGALHLLDEHRAHEVLGVIAHEFCHFVMFKIFDNFANPYQEDDVVNENVFERVIERTQMLKGIEEIIDTVFDSYIEEQQPAELIVRIPHILAHYIDQPEKTRELESTFTELSRYYNEDCIPIMEQQLPIIEEESELRIRKKYTKTNWKLLIGSIVGAVCITICLMIGLYPCLLKSCGDDPYSYCITAGFFKPQCVCIKQNIWDSNICYACLEDKHCPLQKVCLNRKCENTTDLFECINSTQKILMKQRCDGKLDCGNGSDEKYHCRSFKKRKIDQHVYNIFYFSRSIIDDKDYMVNATSDYSVAEGLIARSNKLTKYLPIFIYLKFPYMLTISVTRCGVEKVLSSNFVSLKKLRTINLDFNNIDSIEKKSFDNLESLEKISMNNNKLKEISANLFTVCSLLTTISFKRNLIQQVDFHVFENLTRLNSVNFESNLITNLTTTINFFPSTLNSDIFSVRNNHIVAIHKSLVNLPFFFHNIDFRQNKCIDKCIGVNLSPKEDCFDSRNKTLRKEFKKLLQDNCTIQNL